MKTFLTLAFIALCLTTSAKPTESKLIGYLKTGDYDDLDYACGVLPAFYPKSTNAITTLRGILISNQTLVFIRVSAQAHGGPPTVRISPSLVIRDTARALGNYHVTLNSNELAIIYTLFQTRAENDAMDALKALRGLNNPECVPHILPELQNFSAHVVRDDLRTLAVHGDKSLIPQLEPLTKDDRMDVREDAKAAIKQLEAKP